MQTHAGEVELRGVLDSISNRFYTGGWGWGTLYTDQGIIRITGSLEGHVVGTSLVVRGGYKDTAYGRQLDCSSIRVDSISGNLEVIRAWLRKYCKDADEETVVELCRPLRLEQRWPLLTDKDALETAGLSAEEAVRISSAAELYMVMIALKRGLMEKGFSDHEADKLATRYGEDINVILEADCYRPVIEQVISFNRMDVVIGAEMPRNHPRRLQAAMVQALVRSMRNGHTAQVPRAVYKEAAEMADVYIDAVESAEKPREIVVYNDRLQLRSIAYAEQAIASWVIEAVNRS